MKVSRSKLNLEEKAIVGAYYFFKFVLPGIIFAMILYLFVATKPFYTISDGVMNATSAKMSYKGWIWKTWDGWIPIGVNSEGGLKRWGFTAITEDIAKCVQNNNKIKLYYTDNFLTPYRLGYSHQVYKCEPIK